jgi:hypothetical protein
MYIIAVLIFKQLKSIDVKYLMKDSMFKTSLDNNINKMTKSCHLYH